MEKEDEINKRSDLISYKEWLKEKILDKEVINEFGFERGKDGEVLKQEGFNGENLDGKFRMKEDWILMIGCQNLYINDIGLISDW